MGIAAANVENRSSLFDGAASGGSALSRVSVHRTIVVVFLIDCTIFLTAGLGPIAQKSIDLGFVPATMSPQIVLYGFALFLVLQKLFGSYRRKRIFVEGQSSRRTFLALCIVFSLLFMLAAAAKITSDYSRLWFFTWMVISLIAIPFSHWIALARLRRRLSQGAYVYRAIAVGIDAAPVSQRAMDHDTRGEVHIVRSIRFPNIDCLNQLEPVVANDNIDIIHVSAPWAVAPLLFEAVSRLNHLSANIFVNPVIDTPRPFLSATTTGGTLQIKVLDRPIEGWDLWLKRCLDLCVSYVAIIALSPAMLLIAVAIKLESRGPVVFRQTRHGFNGRTFEILKFRSMYVEASDPFAARQTSRNDERVTGVGRFIRSTSLDELPQLFNVLRGDMSIVGPRPHGINTTAEGNALSVAVREYAFRHRVKPGLTGWAQVNGLRGELDSIDKLRRRVQRDVEYIENWSIGFDLKILFQTLAQIFRDRGAY